ncbi:MAG: HRDC domain-containing protein [Aeriscardovia sp.]|nr:HRDC domain-containing protein [Aeriscardovia sp.]
MRSWVLFARPRAVRLAIAREENRLAFRVFSTSTLQEMAAFQPTSLDGPMDVWSVDEAKDKRCGRRFPDAIVGETD